MSAEATAFVIRHSPYKGAALLAHMMIADTVNDANSNEFWMSVGRLADKCRTQRGTVCRALATMTDDGYVTLLAERPGGTNLYRFEYPEGVAVYDSREGIRRRDDGRKVRAQRAPNDPKVRDQRAGGCALSAQVVRDQRAGPARSARTNSIEHKNNPSGNSKEDVPLTLVSAAPTTDKPDDERVFDAWIACTNRTERTVLSPKRRRLIRNALRDYPIEDVVAAVRGWRRSPFHAGDNPQHTVYNDLGLLLRDAEHIERFRDMERNASSQQAQTQQVPESWRNLADYQAMKGASA